MRVYRFEDESQDEIVGQQYAQLPETCFKYCSSVAFCIDPSKEIGPASILSQLKAYEIPITRKVTNILGYDLIGEIHHYRLCFESQAMIRCITDSIFSWVGWDNHPEDPAFFREDESVFFSSVIHEGYIHLHVRDDEDVSSVISNPGWQDVTNSPTRGYFI